MDDSRDALGSWIEGPQVGAAPAEGDPRYRGERLGLPEEGTGSMAPTGRRLVALVIDWWLCAMVSYGLITHGNLVRANDWTLFVFFVLSVLTVGTIGSTPGKRLLGMRVVRVDGSRATMGQVALRTFLMMLAIPAVIWDRDGRGMHDRLVGTVEVRM
ncbi:RDD family protein [Streptacidiphilus sp. N1-12]|uniref:RDD family protein n=2 Tax=Streptacidiphilus alkalitolerans TaxID=3342712 RepID=A0ABV6WB59_9ACTN